MPLIIALALVIRWDVLMEFQYRPLDPDAVGYRQITEAMKHPYDTSYREPLWIWVIKIWYVLLGSSDLSLRVLSILFSLFLLIGAYKLFSSCVHGALPTLITVTLLAVNPYLAFMSVRGLRLELYTIAILLLIGDVLIPSEKLTAGRRTMGLAVWGTATTMVQLNSLVFVPFLWAYAYWRHRLDWQKAVFMCGTLAVVLTPYLLYCREKYGDPFWSSNVHAKWYRNYEFVARKGIQCEGCPTLEEYQARGHSGAPVTAVHYIFGMHGIGEVITRLGVGYADLFIRPSPYLWRQIGIGMPVLYYVYLVGLAGILLSPARILLAVAVIVINFIAFLIPLGIDARLVMHVAPFVCFVVGYGFWALTECMRWAAKAWVKGETD